MRVCLFQEPDGPNLNVIVIRTILVNVMAASW